MASIHTAQELDIWRESLTAKADTDLPLITVCGGTGCRVYGSEKVWTTFQDELTNQKANARLNYDVKVTGCHGFCEKGPLVVIRPQGIMYTNVKLSDVAEIVNTPAPMPSAFACRRINLYNSPDMNITALSTMTGPALQLPLSITGGTF